jgi:hypothetical protein
MLHRTPTAIQYCPRARAVVVLVESFHGRRTLTALNYDTLATVDSVALPAGAACGGVRGVDVAGRTVVAVSLFEDPLAAVAARGQAATDDDDGDAHTAPTAAAAAAELGAVARGRAPDIPGVDLASVGSGLPGAGAGDVLRDTRAAPYGAQAWLLSAGLAWLGLAHGGQVQAAVAP